MTHINKNVCIKNTSYKKFGRYYWPGTLEDCNTVLEVAFVFPDILTLFDTYDFSEKLCEKTKNWSLGDLTCSALAYKFDGNQLNFVNWRRILSLLLNDEVTNQILFFLQKNVFHEVSNKNEVLLGAEQILETVVFLQISKNSLVNFLSFLRMDSKDSEKLALHTFNTENFDSILRVLKSKEIILLSPLEILSVKISRVLKKLNVHFVKISPLFFGLIFSIFLLYSFFTQIPFQSNNSFASLSNIFKNKSRGEITLPRSTQNDISSAGGYSSSALVLRKPMPVLPYTSFLPPKPPLPFFKNLTEYKEKTAKVRAFPKDLIVPFGHLDEKTLTERLLTEKAIITVGKKSKISRLQNHENLISQLNPENKELTLYYNILPYDIAKETSKQLSVRFKNLP